MELLAHTEKGLDTTARGAASALEHINKVLVSVRWHLGGVDPENADFVYESEYGQRDTLSRGWNRLKSRVYG